MFRPLRTSQLALDVSAAAAITLLCVVGTVAAAADALAAAADVLVCLVLGGALALRRLAPGLALGVAWLAAVLQMAFTRMPAPVDLAVFAVLYTAAAYGSRRVFWLGLVSAVGGSAVITAYLFALGLASGVTGWRSTLVAVLFFAAASFALLLSWTVGALVRTARRATRNRLAQERALAAAAAEAERARIARDMHDVVAHSLAVVIAQADGARYAAASDPAAATAALATISTTARASLADVRMLLAQLRHAQADGPAPTLADLEALYAPVRAAGVDLRVEADPAPAAEPAAAVQLAVYRILQEALTNALRHGDGGPVQVRLAWAADRVDLRVRNSRGPAPPGAGHGLVGMRERAQSAGGRLEAGAEGDDFVVHGTLPLGGAP